MKRALLATAVAALALAAPAKAAVFNFAFVSSTFSLLTTGTLTTSDSLNANGGYDVLAVTGSILGSAITGLSGAVGADNTLFTTPGTSHVSFGGISLTTTGDVYNIYNSTAGDRLYDVNTDPAGPTTGTPGTFGIVALATAVPEPEGWALLGAGFGLVGIASRSRARRGQHTSV